MPGINRCFMGVMPWGGVMDCCQAVAGLVCRRLGAELLQIATRLS